MYRFLKAIPAVILSFLAVYFLYGIAKNSVQAYVFLKYDKPVLRRESRRLMPRDINDLYIGMSSKELRQKRRIYLDSGSAVVIVNNNFFYRNALCSFRSAWGEDLFFTMFPVLPDKINEIILDRRKEFPERKRAEEYLNKYLNGFLYGCVKKWGSDYHQKMHINTPALFWRKGKIAIIAGFDVYKGTISGEGYFSSFRVTIFNKKLEDYEKYLRTPTQKEIRRYFMPLNNLSSMPDGPIFE